MAKRLAAACDMVSHARFLKFLTKAVRAANDDWRRRRPDLGGEVMSREGLVSHLHHWRLARGGAPTPAQRPTVALAALYKADPAAVVAEARRYWRKRTTEETAPS